MRNKRLVEGLNNSQKIRVIVNGVGFCTTVQGVYDMTIYSQRMAVTMALQTIGWTLRTPNEQKISSFGRRYDLYDHEGKMVGVDVQVDLV